DDEAPVLSLAQNVLERVGLTVLTATDGEEAVSLFSKHSSEIRAVLLDLTMPGMDGVEVFQSITEMRPDIRVVLCSGFNEQDVSTRLGERRPAGFLRKPYHPSELIERLQAAW